MIRKLLFVAMIALGSNVAAANVGEAQTTSSMTNDLLRETNALIREAEIYLDNVAEPAAQQYQQYLNQLLYACVNLGNTNACQEYDVRMQRQQQQLDQMIIRTNPNAPHNRNWAESFCHPYCN